MRPRTVVVADDHPLFRRGLRAAIEHGGRYRVVAEAGNGDVAIEALAEHSPDIAVIDLAMPGRDGLAVAGWAEKHRPDTAVVVLTLYRAPAYVDRAIAAGVAGYVVKDDAEAEILRCLDLVGAGEFYASPNLKRPAIAPPPLAASDEPAVAKLTNAQRAVLRLLADYHTSREIADVLGISVKTVENYRANIVARLHLRGPNALLRFAVRHRRFLVS